MGARPERTAARKIGRHSAGILVHRRSGGGTEVLLVHPGGPYWRNRDLGAWSIPKGEYSGEESAEAAARREFAEETGWTMEGGLTPLGQQRQRSGKIVTAFAAEGTFDAASLRSNLFEMEWPPHSGRTQAFAEVDRAGWFPLPEARRRIVAGQRPFLDRLAALIGGRDLAGPP